MKKAERTPASYRSIKPLVFINVSTYYDDVNMSHSSHLFHFWFTLLTYLLGLLLANKERARTKSSKCSENTSSSEAFKELCQGQGLTSSRFRSCLFVIPATRCLIQGLVAGLGHSHSAGMTHSKGCLQAWSAVYTGAGLAGTYQLRALFFDSP